MSENSIAAVHGIRLIPVSCIVPIPNSSNNNYILNYGIGGTPGESFLGTDNINFPIINV